MEAKRMDTSKGYARKKPTSEVVDYNKQTDLDYARDATDEAPDQISLFDRDYKVRTPQIFRPLLSIDQIMTGRKATQIACGIYMSACISFFYFGYPIVGGVFAFLASGPVVFLRNTKKALSKKILRIDLLPDQISVKVSTAFDSFVVPINGIKPAGDFITLLQEHRDKFEETKKPDFKPSQTEQPLSQSIFIDFEGVTSSTNSKVQPTKMALELDPLLYGIDNYDLFVDTITGKSEQVQKYKVFAFSQDRAMMPGSANYK